MFLEALKKIAPKNRRDLNVLGSIEENRANALKKSRRRVEEERAGVGLLRKNRRDLNVLGSIEENRANALKKSRRRVEEERAGVGLLREL